MQDNSVIISRDFNIIYQLVTSFCEQQVDKLILDHLKQTAAKIDLTEWENLIYKVSHLRGSIRIALVGKYVQLHDAYLSVMEALKSAGYQVSKTIDIDWIQADSFEDPTFAERLLQADGIIIPGGFGIRATEGLIKAAKIAREQGIPFLGICYGMQLAVISFLRDVGHIVDASSTEIDPQTQNPVIDYLPDQYKELNIGGTLRLGIYDCQIVAGTHTHSLYGQDHSAERHRHRFEFNNKYREIMEDNGMVVAGFNPLADLVEIVEIPTHPFYIGCQFHPEFKSRPTKPHPLFLGFIRAAAKYSEK